jgi:chemotaxis protein MotB
MAGKSKQAGDNAKTVLIRKEEVVEGGHHGGAWKVAYADFVTAMMAFFLLMWLINATSEEQRRGLADYFSKSNVFSHQSSGSGKPFGGKTPFEEGSMVSNRGAAQVTAGTAEESPDTDQDGDQTPARVQMDPDPTEDVNASGQEAAGSGGGLPGNARTFRAETGKPSLGDSGPDAPGGARAPATASAAAATPPPPPAPAAATISPPPPSGTAKSGEAARAEEAAFQQAAREIKAAIENDPGLREFAKQLAIDETPEGLRIQILDEEKRPMFDLGASAPNERAQKLLAKIAPALARLPERLSIAGYTDAAPYRGVGKSNWDLSTERANATRHFLADSGLPESRFETVTGHADHQLLLPGDPLAAANRRIAVVVLRAAASPPKPAQHAPADAPTAPLVTIPK